VSADGTALARLCSLTADAFADVWGRRPWYSAAADLDGDDALFSAAAVDELLSQRGLRTPFLRLAKDGRIVPPARYTGSGGIGATIADQVLDDAVLGLFADGTTVVLQGVHRTWAPVGELAAELAAELGHPVQVNAYVTPPQSQGFAPHYDTHDVFVLQVAGRKAWRVHEPVLEAPLPDEPWDRVADAVAARAVEAPTLDVVLEPGDALYLPRGFLHAATALGGTSIHLTFGLHVTTEQDLLQAVLDGLDRSRWRRSMPAGWTPTGPDGVAALRAVAAELAEALATLDPAVVATALHDERAARQRPEPIAPLAQAEAAATVGLEQVVRLRRHLGARLDAEAGASVLVCGTRRIALDAAAAPAVARLLEGAAIRVADLPFPASDAEPALQVVRRLVTAGVLVTVGQPES
jgi:hypothetical protein